ncbi:hypothetical protein DYI37_04040 [Fulvimarina endophytica]|uniref:Uncharacterized protein n=1 Tax=Fulvimarina endophytica TaxID=2293836 RepID=A0A371X740_9HYPH|nr:hypothetical protein [Fulvimarina endophytica]RFC65045.1 hypothetical protein DYI37_04040 [Fulvimarina endophytica]
MQSFEIGKRGVLIADPAVEVQSQEQATRMSQRLMERKRKVGVVAFSREGDPALGEFEEAQIIFASGQVPAEVEDMAA